MAATGVLGAIQDYFATLTFAGKPGYLWFGDQIPLIDPAGTAVDLPLCRFTQDGMSTAKTLEDDVVFTFMLRFDCWAATLGAVESLTYGLLFNLTTPSSRVGLSLPDSITVPAEWKYLSLELPEGQGPVFASNALVRQASAVPAFSGTFNLNYVVQRVG